MTMSKSEAARAMRMLPPQQRDELIEAALNVVDLRGHFEERRKQRAIAAKYRRPRKPGGVA